MLRFTKLAVTLLFVIVACSAAVYAWDPPDAGCQPGAGITYGIDLTTCRNNCPTDRWGVILDWCSEGCESQYGPYSSCVDERCGIRDPWWPF